MIPALCNTESKINEPLFSIGDFVKIIGYKEYTDKEFVIIKNPFPHVFDINETIYLPCCPDCSDRILYAKPKRIRVFSGNMEVIIPKGSQCDKIKK